MTGVGWWRFGHDCNIVSQYSRFGGCRWYFDQSETWQMFFPLGGNEGGWFHVLSLRKLGGGNSNIFLFSARKLGR